MSHIDEGTLHAYLDGALDAYPAGEAERVRGHLESCGECARRLDEERALRAEAEAILATAAPEVQAPPLEELRAEAERRKRSEKARGLTRVNRWAWAASVVLALGTGWMLRGNIGSWMSRPAPREEMARPSVATESAAEQGAAGVEADAPTDEAMETEAMETDVVETEAAELVPGSAAGDLSVEAPSPTVEEEAAAPPPPPSQRSSAGAGAAEPALKTGPPPESTPRSAARPAETATALADSVLTAGDSVARTGQAQDPVRFAREAPVVEALQAERAPLQVDVAPEARFRVRGRPTPLSLEAPGADSVYAFVPGLPVLSADRVDVSPGGAILIRQLTETGDTLETIHLPEGAVPPVASLPAREGVNEVVVFRGGIWLIVRGPLTEDALMAYVERIPYGR